MEEENEFNFRVVETTRRFIEDEFKERFKKTGNSILVEKPFQKVAEHYIRKKVPAYLRTEKALSTNSDAILKMKKTIDGFLYKIESKELGWQYVLRKDGYAHLKLFDECGEHLLDSNFHTLRSSQRPVTKEEQINNMLKRWTASMEINTEIQKEEDNNGKEDTKE